MRDAKILLVAGLACLILAMGWKGVRGTEPFVSPGAVLGGPGDEDARGNQPTLAIVFSAQECGTLIESLRFWNESHRQGLIRVNGWLYGRSSDPDILRKVIRGSNLVFPVRRIDQPTLDAVRASLGYRGESFVVVVDAVGRVRLAKPLSELSSADALTGILRFATGVPAH
jgi:hypothetical protein